MKLDQLKWEQQNKTAERSQKLWGFDQAMYVVMRTTLSDGNHIYSMLLWGADVAWNGLDPSAQLADLVDWDTRKMTALELKCWRQENGR